jgi:glycosyltransferase involved in cell wall biosynthesis
MLAYAEARVWNRKKLNRITSHFICPSEFIRKKMIAGGFDQHKLSTIHNFIVDDLREHKSQTSQDFYCYVGRLSEEKGVETLLKAARNLPEYHLKIIGSGPLSDYFLEHYNDPHIEFCGHKSKNEVQELLSEAVFSVMPSECYENNPLAVIESLCLGTPVIGANIGGIPELITEKINGSLFESGNQSDLANIINNFMSSERDLFETKKIATRARERYSSEHYYTRLIGTYKSYGSA